MICKYFLPFNGLSFYSNSFVDALKFLIFKIEVPLIYNVLVSGA